MTDLTQLCENLGYEFSDKKLLERALCHRSFGTLNNERLEFLGDAAVNFIIGEALFKSFRKAKEGDLSRLRASLVKGEALAELAKQFSLSKFLRLGHGEQRSGGANRESILADAMEAIIGAIYLDSNFITCQKIVLAWYQSRLGALDSPANLKDPKTRLQEYLQAHKFALPHYRIIKTKGEAHNQTFHIECVVEGLTVTSIGKGLSRRKAEQDAAMRFIGLLQNEE